jgi:hypothetical protein
MNGAPVIAALLLAAVPAYAVDTIVPQCWDERLPDGSIGHNCEVDRGPPAPAAPPEALPAPMARAPVLPAPPVQPPSSVNFWVEAPWVQLINGVPHYNQGPINYSVLCWAPDPFVPRQCGWLPEQCEALRQARHGGVCTPSLTFPQY